MKLTEGVVARVHEGVDEDELVALEGGGVGAQGGDPADAAEAGDLREGERC